MNSERKNIDYVAIDHQLECSWRFILAGKAKQASDVTQDVLEITKGVYQTGRGWLSPYEVRYGITVIAEDVPIKEFIEGTVEKSLSRHEVMSEPKLSHTELETAIETTRSKLDAFPILTSVDFRGISSKLHLAAGDKYVTRDSNLAKTWAHGTVLDEGPYWDPLTLNMKVAPPWRTPRDSQCAYELTVVSNTDIWFADNEYGRLNRKRLAMLLGEFYERFDVRELELDSNRFEEADLRSFISDN